MSCDAGGTTYNNFFDLYTGLQLGEYKVKITLLKTRVGIDHFYYTTYCIQRPASIFALKSGSGGTAASIAEVPPATSLLTGTWASKNYSENTIWNNSFHLTQTSGDYVEFKFYGSKVWFIVQQRPGTSNADVNFLIDGSTSNVRAGSGYNINAPNNTTTLFYRIDNGSLPEGWHTVRITATTIAGGSYFNYCGFSFYSATAPSTICRSLILGKSSYAIGADDSGLSYTGTWVGLGDEAAGFLRRRNYTLTNASYVSVTTPANAKAIYIIAAINNSTAGTELKITLGGAKTRYVDLQTTNIYFPSFIIPVYDSFADGDISSQELRVIHNGTTTSEEFIFYGFIFEIGDPVEDGYLMAMPKWTRFNASTNVNTPVSNTHRLDVYGVKSDQSDGRSPQIHSGWFYGNFNQNIYYRYGVFNQMINSYLFNVQSLPMSNLGNAINSTIDTVSYGPTESYRGLLYKSGSTTNAGYWYKYILDLKEVV
jgi:hypothetical protein